MCGIAGIFHPGDHGDLLPALTRMTEAMTHRGPDAGGHHAEGPVALGHRRLSIIDLSESANQPFFEASGRYVMVFNGEMYNFMEVRVELDGYPFRTQGDSEVLIAAFAKWGPECVRRFKGMFAFAIWDRQEKTLTLCRDRLGVKPIYYHQNDGSFSFASELRAILAQGNVKRKLDREALRDYLGFQSFGSPASPIAGIRQLEAGTYMQVSASGIRTTRYWEPRPADLPASEFRDVDTVRRNVRKLLHDAVTRRLVSDVPVGAFLSGGIDSSVVVGMMAEAGHGRPETFNISFTEKEYDESAYANLIAEKFNAHHHTIRMRPEVMLDELEHALGALDTPSGDGVNTYVVSKAIRNAGITVALSGVGGDELFAGYPFFKQYLGIHKYKGLLEMTGPLRRMAGRMVGRSTSGKLGRMAQVLGAKTMGIDGLYPVFRQLLSPSLMAELTTLPGNGATSLEAQLEARAEQWSNAPLLSQVSMAEYLGYTQQTLLKDTDQMSMASSLEVREPFFDHELIEYVLAIPDQLKYPHYPKQLLVESVAPMLPDEVVHRRKQGFLFPWAVWMKNELRTFCTEHIDRIAQRDIVRGDGLRKYWKRFLDGDPSVRWAELWLFIVLEYWMEKNHVES